MVSKAVNALMKVIHIIEGDANQVKISPWKIKQPNLEVMKYIKGGKYPDAEVVKYVYAVREIQSLEVIQYVRIQLSVSHDVTWGDWYITLRSRWMKKEEKHLKLFNLECVDPLRFRWLVQSTWQMALTDDLCELHKRHSRISLGMNSKCCSDDRKRSDHKKHTN